jgi:predicted RNA-binding Zn-ribbon protein involved in translation (DUF1610 family)
VARARSLSEFQTSFPDETSCAAFLFQRRWPQGFVCPACGGGRAALLKSRAHTHECLQCGRQTSITAGTAMHRSKLPLTVWFWAAHLMATHSNGMSAVQLEAPLGVTYKTAWLLAQKLRRSMIDPQREPLEGVVEVDQAEIPFRADNSFFDPVKSGKILIVGAVEVIDRGTNQAKPRRRGAKYLDTRSGRIRLAAIRDNSAASIEAFVRANVKTGTTLLIDGHRSYPGLTDYRHDPRTVGKMAGHIVLPWIHRVFALMKRWGLGTIMGCAASTSTRISTSLSSDTIGASTGTSRSKPSSGSPRTITRRVTGISSGATIPAKACRRSGARHGAAGQQPACGQTDQDLPKKSNPAPFQIRPASPRY